MKPNENTIIIYSPGKGKPELKVSMNGETIWLTQAQIADIFNTERSVITKHLRNIFNSGELEEKSNVQKMHIPDSDKPVKLYSLDAVISVGYRVNSKQATQFRIWATSILREYIYNGIVLNERRLGQVATHKLEQLQKAVTLLQKVIQTKSLNKSEATGLLSVITEYANTWTVLQEYDEGVLLKKGVKKKGVVIEYSDSLEAVATLKKKLMSAKRASELFGTQRDRGFETALASIYQGFGGKELYPSLEEKAAHLLYFIIKNHPFVDGNKRIGSFMFIVFLTKNNYLLKKNGEKKINDNALVALALLIAESKPNEKETMISLVTNLLHS